MTGEELAIIGAGPCGIGAAWTLQHEFPNHKFRLFEAAAKGGGYAASETTTEGFVFDNGGHVLFPHRKYKEFSDFVNGLISEWSYSCPVRGVYLHDRLIPFPLQRNIHRLPLSEFVPILSNLVSIRFSRAMNSESLAGRSSEESLADYLLASFGPELTKRVMEPLNKKMWTLSPCDPRITPVGNFLRKCSIDELPQLFNVLRGDMSLIGPRPLAVSMLENFPQIRAARSVIRPGITGLWQVKHRMKNVSIHDMIDDDLEYIAKYSFSLDLTGHDRMPVICKPSDYQRWLEPGAAEQQPLTSSGPHDSDRMNTWRAPITLGSAKFRGTKLRGWFLGAHYAFAS